jgi:hypothetical protein
MADPREFRAAASPAYTVPVILKMTTMNNEQFGTIRGWMYVVGVVIMAGAFWLSHR